MAIASFIAGEPISAGQAIYVSSAGLIYKASALTSDQASVAGIAIDAGAFGDLIRVNTDSLYTGYSGLTPGELQYLSITASGQLVNYTTWETQLSNSAIDAYLELVGRAVSTSGISVEISKPQYIVNPTEVLLLEGSPSINFDAILLEDGSTISLETAV
jgi:hypothetical protein